MNNSENTALKVLLVDDDIDLGGLINSALSVSGYDVHYQNSLTGINSVIEQFNPHVIVLDVEIGKQNGIDEAANIIGLYPGLPIIFISSHTKIENINRGLSTGGVTYLKKPFDIEELEAYIQRFALQNQQTSSIDIGMYSLHINEHKLTYKEEIVKQLSPLEKNGLLLLIKNKGQVVSRDRFSKELWGSEFSPANEASLNNLIARLRRMIKNDARLDIKTVKSKGYMLVFNS